jgi:uncharacterized protein (DUF1778 family)
MSKKGDIRHADNKGRIAIPEFANATLIVERIDANEYRLKKATVVPTKALEFHEEKMFPLKLSARDSRTLLDLLDNPPAPNQAARKAAKEFKKNHGRLER